jgi:hypothetical protein
VYPKGEVVDYLRSIKPANELFPRPGRVRSHNSIKAPLDILRCQEVAVVELDAPPQLKLPNAIADNPPGSGEVGTNLQVSADTCQTFEDLEVLTEHRRRLVVRVQSNDVCWHGDDHSRNSGSSKGTKITEAEDKDKQGEQKSQKDDSTGVSHPTYEEHAYHLPPA